MNIEERLQNIVAAIVKKMGIDDFDDADLPGRVIEVEDLKGHSDSEIKKMFYLSDGWQVCETEAWKVDNNGFPAIQYSYSIEGMPTKYRPKIKYVKIIDK